MKRVSIVLGLVMMLGMVSGCLDSDSGGSVGERGEGGGFVWKPRSESDGRLVVLMPPQYRGNVQSAHIANSSGGVVEQGRFAGDVHNGRRPHYRFSEHGSAYGPDLFFVADLQDGRTIHWPIANGASRQEY